MAKKDPKDSGKDDRYKDETKHYGDGGSRTDYNLYDWSGRQLDDYKDVRRKGSDR